AAGCSEEEATRIAYSLVKANLCGHDSHGVIRVALYLRHMREGEVVPGQSLTVISENEVMAVVDGNYGFGQTIGTQAVRLGVDKAVTNGVSIIALRNSGHLGRIGEWSEMAAAADQISVHFVNAAGAVLVAPFGGVERRMSTNPVAIGVPAPDRGPPLILDFATAVVAGGKAMVAAKGGKKLPEDSLIDGDGRPTSDPMVIFNWDDSTRALALRKGPGAIRAIGEYKGSGLSFMCEMLAGALTGSGCSGPDRRRLANGMLSIYMAPEVFDSDDRFAAQVREYVDFFKSAKPAAPDGEVLTPGEPEQRMRERRLAEGIDVPDPVWQTILQSAGDVGMSPREIDAAIGGAHPAAEPGSEGRT
ncbi:MAG: Ldh family oxidoreductase, partial [Kiloniellales bacterium]